MPKLFQINVSANWGSTGKIAESIGAFAIKNGWESYIAYRRNHNLSKSELIEVSGKYGKYTHYLGSFLFDKEGLFSSNDTRKLIKKIKEIKPDIVHLHNIHDHWLNYKLLFEYLNTTHIQVVWTFHDCWAFTGHCFHFVTKNCERWKTGCYDCPLQHDYPKTLIDRSRKNFALKKQLFGNCKNLTIVPVSDWMASFVKESFLKQKRVNVIKNGIDLSVFHSLNNKPKDGRFRVLAVSNIWNKGKGLYDIFKLRSFLSDDFIITVVGLTSEQVEKLPIGIVGIQRTQSLDELVSLYSESDVLINPTYADSFPTVNLEALACGTPVITYKTGGSPEAIDSKTGVVIDQGDIVALANSIKSMKDSPLSSIECRKRAEENFDKEQCYEKYVQLFEDILLNGKKSNQEIVGSDSVYLS